MANIPVPSHPSPRCVLSAVHTTALLYSSHHSFASSRRHRLLIDIDYIYSYIVYDSSTGPFQLGSKCPQQLRWKAFSKHPAYCPLSQVADQASPSILHFPVIIHLLLHRPASNNGLPPSPQRPVLNRPFSDGSMTVESSILSSLMGATQPFSFSSGSLPSQAGNNPFDYNMVSPHSANVDLPSSASPHGFQPHAMFGHLNFGAENREPPIVAASADNTTSHNRSRSQSSSRSSNIGKAPTARSRSGRKLSMNDVRPNIQPSRGRAMQPPRSLSFQTDSKPPASLLGLGPQRSNSITSASADYAFEQQYGIAIPRSDFSRGLWGSAGSAPSVLPEGMASYGASMDAAASLER